MLRDALSSIDAMSLSLLSPFCSDSKDSLSALSFSGMTCLPSASEGKPCVLLFSASWAFACATDGGGGRARAAPVLEEALRALFLLTLCLRKRAWLIFLALFSLASVICVDSFSTLGPWVDLLRSLTFELDLFRSFASPSCSTRAFLASSFAKPSDGTGGGGGGAPGPSHSLAASSLEGGGGGSSASAPSIPRGGKSPVLRNFEVQGKCKNCA